MNACRICGKEIGALFKYCIDHAEEARLAGRRRYWHKVKVKANKARQERRVRAREANQNARQTD